MLKKEIDYTDYVGKLNSSPIFISIAKNFDYERIGLQILDKEKVIQEFTSYNNNGKITKIEEGLNQPDLTAKIEKKTIEEMISNQTWIQKHPLQAAIKYAGKVKLPFVVKLKLLKLLKNIYS